MAEKKKKTITGQVLNSIKINKLKCIKKNNFEESLKKLEKISTSLKAEDITLEDAIKQYEEGIRYYKECSEILQDAQQRIETLTKQE